MIAPSVNTLLASAVRTANTTVDPASILFPRVTGGETVAAPVPADTLIAYLNITVVPGIDTVLLKMQEKDPVSGVWSDVPGAATLAQVATGLVRFAMGPGIAAVAASASAVGVNAYVPPFWRFVVVHSAASSFTYSLAVAVDISA